MLNTLREHSQSFLIYLIFAVLIVVFAVNFGPGSTSCGGPSTDYAAKVNGEIIRRQDFSLRYSRQLDNYRRNFSRSGGELTPEMIERLGLRKQVIDELINKRLLSLEARERGLTVTDDELLDRLKTQYGVDNVSFDQYERWVRRTFSQTVPAFEEEVRADIAGEKVSKVLTETITVSGTELESIYVREHDRAMVWFVRFDTTTAEVPPVTDAQIDAVLADEKDAVKERYEKDILLYRSPKQVKARQILKKLARDASDADVAKARSALMELKEQIDGGADFAALAKEHSEDEATKEKGGDMGFFKRGQMLKPITDATFSLKADEITKEPVRSPLGMHLLQVTEVKQPGRKELSEVEREVAKSLLESRQQEGVAKGDAEAFLAQLKSGKAIEDVTVSEEEEREAKEKNAPLAKPVRRDTAWILKSQDSVPRIGASKEMLAGIFTLTKENPVLPEAIKVGRSYFVVMLKDREIPDMEKFAEEKDSLEDQAIWSKRSAVYRDWLAELRNRATVVLNPELFPPAEAEPAS